MPSLPELSRRNWLVVVGGAGVVASLSGCRTAEPTRMPASGPEPARALSERGARNLLALAELSAALRWLHPSDEALVTEWEPLLLEGVRTLESAATPAELAEGLRGLLGAVAPTLTIWRAEKESGEAAELDADACAEPEELEKSGDRARASEGTQTRGKAGSDRPKPPARTTRPVKEEAGEAEDAKAESAESGESKSGESKSSESGDSKAELPKVLNTKSTDPNAEREAKESSEPAREDLDPGAPPKVEERQADSDDKAEPDKAEPDKAEPEKVEPENAEPQKAEPDKAEPQKAEPDKAEPDELEPRPELPAELLAQGDAIVQWHRRGFASDEDDPIACARRLALDPDTRPSCTEPPAKPRRRARPDPCSSCSSDDLEVLVPALPLELALPRGLQAAIPIALWSGDTGIEPAPAFDLDRALEYGLADRATRLLAVIQAWSVLRWFFPHPPTDPQSALREALCMAAEHEGADAATHALERLLARFADGNARLQPHVDRRRDARRFRPPVGFAWVAERVVAYPLPDHPDELSPLRAGDVVIEIDGEPIEQRLAEQLSRTAAASPSARVQRAVERLFERADEDAPIELRVLREDGEQRVTVKLRASEPSEALPSGGDLRPRERLTELREGVVYVDATRVPNLRAVARRLRHAEVVIVDLRGTLADERRSFADHWTSESLPLIDERILVGPTRAGELTLEPFATRTLEPVEPRLSAALIVLADHRTRARAELELVGFARLGARIIGSTSAGELATTATTYLPGGVRLRFSQTDALRHEGTPAWAQGVAPTRALEPSWPAAREHDELLDAALQMLE